MSISLAEKVKTDVITLSMLKHNIQEVHNHHYTQQKS